LAEAVGPALAGAGALDVDEERGPQLVDPTRGTRAQGHRVVQGVLLLGVDLEVGLAIEAGGLGPGPAEVEVGGEEELDVLRGPKAHLGHHVSVPGVAVRRRGAVGKAEVVGGSEPSAHQPSEGVGGMADLEEAVAGVVVGGVLLGGAEAEASAVEGAVGEDVDDAGESAGAEEDRAWPFDDVNLANDEGVEAIPAVALRRVAGADAAVQEEDEVVAGEAAQEER